MSINGSPRPGNAACNYPKKADRDRANTKFLDDFPALHEKVMGRDLSAVGCRSEVRSFFLECVREKSDHRYAYRYLDLDLEGDLASKLDAFQPVATGDRYRVDVHHLRLLRRFAFQRYAFRLAWNICGRLVHQDKKQRVKRRWIYKDFALPRVPLALVVGYGIVLGSFKDWLIILGHQPWFAAGLVAGTLVVSWFLIYCNVRDRIGEASQLFPRAAWVFAGCLLWSGLLLGFGRQMARLDQNLENLFDLNVALCLGSSSLLVAIVVQFFFAKAISIADPL